MKNNIKHIVIAGSSGGHILPAKPPGPFVDRFHGGVEAHGPSPEQRASFCASTAVCNLIDFAVSPIATGLPKELGGRDGPEPVRYGDWEKNGIAVDF